MNERAAFLEAIRADQTDDTVRLIYADWLDEQESDQDRARAEYIRMSCMGATAQSPRTGKWLDANWHRLLPTIGRTRTPGAWRAGYTKRRGRRLNIEYQTRMVLRREVNTIHIDWWRGFADRFLVKGAQAFFAYAGLLRRDEPLIKPTWQSPSCYYHNHLRAWCYARSTWGEIYHLLEGFDTDHEPSAVRSFHGDFNGHNRAIIALQLASEKWMDQNPGVFMFRNSDFTWDRYHVNDVALVHPDQAD